MGDQLEGGGCKDTEDQLLHEDCLQVGEESGRENHVG